MAATNINRVILTGNLTRDPELRSTNSGLNICSLRLAVNSRRKDGQSGQWIDEPNYFDITVFGAQGENCARFLSRGRPVAIDGRLKWREWEGQNGEKRQAVEVIADSVQFLGGGEGGGQQGGGSYGGGQSFSPQQSDVRSDTSDFQPQPSGVGAANGHSAPPQDDDIPF